MAIVQSFRELLVWQRSIELSLAVYKLTSSFPRDEVYGLTSQIRRASVSIACNIAEGQGRATAGEFRQFLRMARGSNLEMQTQLVIARELGYGEAVSVQRCDDLASEVGRMLNGLMKSLCAKCYLR